MNDSMIPSIPAQPEHKFEDGPNSNNFAATAVGRHPVDDLQRTINENPFQNLEYVRHVYGSALAMRLATEQKIAGEQHIPGSVPIARANLYKEVVSGQDVQLDFSDFLSLPQNCPDAVEKMPHSVMEAHLGM